jgi:hypothetical protein
MDGLFCVIFASYPGDDDDDDDNENGMFVMMMTAKKKGSMERVGKIDECTRILLK